MFAKPAAELKMWFAGRLLGTGESGERDSGLRHAEAATAAQAGVGVDRQSRLAGQQFPPAHGP